MTKKVLEVPKHVAHRRVTREKGGEMEKGAAACCRAVAVYSLHTMTNLCPDELECDKNAGLDGRAKAEVRRAGNI